MVASDQLTNFKKPLLLLKVQTSDANGQEKKETLLELDSIELKSLLKSLKSAQKVTLFVGSFICLTNYRRSLSCNDQTSLTDRLIIFPKQFS